MKVKFGDLYPHWLSENLLIFKCPTCRDIWLSCKNAVMSEQEQFKFAEMRFGDEWAQEFVPCNPTTVWAITGSLEAGDIDIQPSVDASNSGHWHGVISRGEIC